MYSALAGGQVDAGFEALAAIRTLHGHELLELAALRRAGRGARLEYGFEAVELIDVLLFAAGDALAKRIERYVGGV